MAYVCKMSDSKLSCTGLRVEFMLYSIQYTLLLHGILVVSQSFNIQWKLPSARGDFPSCLQPIQKLQRVWGPSWKLIRTKLGDKVFWSISLPTLYCTNLSTQNPQQHIKWELCNLLQNPYSVDGNLHSWMKLLQTWVNRCHEPNAVLVMLLSWWPVRLGFTKVWSWEL